MQDTLLLGITHKYCYTLHLGIARYFGSRWVSLGSPGTLWDLLEPSGTPLGGPRESQKRN